MAGSSPVRFGDLGPRVVSGVALAVIAALALWAGGVWAAVLVLLALFLMLWEFSRMVAGEEPGSGLIAALAVVSAVSVVLAGWVSLGAALAVLLAGGFAASFLDDRLRHWLPVGAFYMGGAICALLALRLSGQGLVVLWLVLVVIAADVGAYFTGRIIGGAKLWPAVSPGKTRSGALGGLGAAGLVGAVFAALAGWSVLPAFAASVLVAAGSQAGDLLESAVKRRFGVKDSSQIIPGHGGVMDRLDGITGGTWICLALLAVGLGFQGQ